ncbi:MAG: Gfo/Idh/MocA family oxidoreductase [Gemmatimonadota bacterium]|nr:Gfo/Idh/MocA family oxidoreductase [Gemmatimonadota bacterium]
MSAAAPLRVAVIGAGLMGRWHADAAVRNGARIVAIADPDPSRAAVLARRYGAAGRDGLPAILREGAPDVVHLCTPLGTHQALAAAALRAGAHVLVEKPLSHDAASTRELLDLAQRQRRILCPVHQFLFQSGVLRAGRVTGDIAPLLHIDATICSAGGAGLPQEERDRIAVDILPHPLSLVTRFLGTPLAAVRWVVSRPRGGELRLAGGGGESTVSILVSMGGRPTANEMRIIGERGTIHLDLFHGFAVIERGGTSRARKIARPFSLAASSLGAASWNLSRRLLRREAAYPGLLELVRRLYGAVRAGEDSPISVHETLDVAAARDAVLSAMPWPVQQGRSGPVALPPQARPEAT